MEYSPFMSIEMFIEYCLTTTDESFEENFKERDLSEHVDLVIGMIEFFRIWKREHFLEYRNKNTINILFNNLSSESYGVFLSCLRMHHAYKNSWATHFAVVFPRVDRIHKIVSENMVEK